MNSEAGRLRVLIVEDRAEDAEMMAYGLTEAGYAVSWERVDTEADYLMALSGPVDVVLADYAVPSFSALRALELLRQQKPDVPLVIVSGMISEETAVDCLKAGAADYLVKDRMHRLPAAVAQALEQYRLRESNRRIEDALRHSEARFRLAFDSAPIGMALVAPDGRWLETNPALCRIVGYSADELQAKTFQDITHPADLDADLACVRQMLAGEIETYTMEKRYLHADGHVVWINLSVSLARDAGGVPQYFISQIEDISHRKANEQALRLSHQLLEGSQALAHVGSWEWDTAAGPGSGAQWSKEMYRIHGVEPGSFVMTKESVDALIHPDDLDTFIGAFGQAMLTGEDLKGFTYRALRPDGSTRWVWVQGGFAPDRPGILAGFAQDVTEWRLAQEKLEEADRMKDDFLAVTAHELRTPITSVLGFAQLLTREWDGLQPEEGREFCETIERQARVLSRLVEDLLTLSALQAGAVGFDLDELDAATVLRQAVYASGLPGQVEVRCPAGLGLVGDVRRVEQILTNYLTNAVKHGAGPIELSAIEAGAWVELRVTDHGPGVPEDFVPQLFEKFSQATRQGRRARGCGLGLAIVRSLAEGQGGQAWYEPRPTGACFAVRLPAARALAVTAGAQGAQA